MRYKYQLFIFFVLLLVFGQIVKFDFVNLDDQAHIEQNTALKEFNFWHIWTHEHKDMYIPVLYTTLSLQAAISPDKPTFHPPNIHVKNLDPLVFHATSLALHITNCLLLFYFLLGFSFAAPVAGAAAMLYGIHPLQVEVVAWISAQKDLVSSFFGLISLLYFQRKFILNKSPKGKNLLILSGLVLLAILAKPTTIVLPPVMFFWWVYVSGHSFASGIKWLWPPLILSVLFAVITAGQQPASALPFKTNLLERLWVSLDSVTFYILKFFWPLNLTVEYGRNPPYFLQSPERFWTWIPAAILIAIIYRYWKHFSPNIKLGIFLSGIAIFPVLGLKSFVYQNVSTVSDRYMSVPLIGLALIFAQTLQGLKITDKRWRNAIGALICSVLVFFGTLSFQTSKHWLNSETLWARVIAINPRSWFAYNNWAAHFEVKGNRKQAIELYEKSIELRPDSMLYTRVGILYFDENQFDKARLAFQHALRLDPNNPIARQNLQVLQ